MIGPDAPFTLRDALADIEKLRWDWSNGAINHQSEKRNFAQSMFDKFSQALRIAAMMTREGRQLPVELEIVLSASSEWFGWLAAGQVPDIIQDAGQVGSHRPVPPELRQIGLAVAYRRATDPEGIPGRDGPICIADRAPIKTLAEWFGVHRRTIQGWVQNHQPTDVTHILTPNAFEDLVKNAGSNYKRQGRSATAINQRARKRGEHQ